MGLQLITAVLAVNPLLANVIALQQHPQMDHVVRHHWESINALKAIVAARTDGVVRQMLTVAPAVNWISANAIAQFHLMELADLPH